MLETRISPADLLRLRKALGSWKAVCEIGGAVGFVRLPDDPRLVKSAMSPPDRQKETADENPDQEEEIEITPPDYGGDRRLLRFALPVFCKTLAAPSAIKRGSDREALTDEQIALPEEATVPERFPLVPWARLQALFRLALGREVSGQRIDVDRLVRDLATGRAVKEIPRLKQQSATGRAVLILDFSDESCPFWRDFSVLAGRLLRERGRSSLRVLELEGGSPLSLKKRIEPGVPVMVAGTMGLYRQEGGGLVREWQELGCWLNERGQKGYALLPVPRRRWCKDLARVWNCLCWDAWERIPHGGGLRALPGSEVNQEGSRKLLTHLAMASRVPFSLAREVRLSLDRTVDVGAEYEAWKHEDTWPCNLSYGLAKGKAGSYLHRLKDESEEARQTAAEIIARHHNGCSELRKLEVELRKLHVGVPLTREKEEEIEKLLWAVVQRLRRAEPLSLAEKLSGVPAWVEDTLQRFPEDMREMEPFKELWARALTQTHRWKNERNHAWLPGTDLESAHDELANPDTEIRSWYLHEVSHGIRISSEPGGGYSLGQIKAGEWVDVVEEGGSRRVALDEDSLVLAWSGRSLLLHSFVEQVGFLKVKRPPWATKWIRTREGIEVEALLRPEEESVVNENTPPKNAIKRRLRWHLPEFGVHGFWENDAGEIADPELDWDLLSMLPTEWKVGSPGDGPAWASRKGTDDYGSYAEWEHEGVVFRFRWIPPGEFLMGSPEEEKGRWSDEGPQHEVQLTKGFWMLETPVTQELWLVGGRENPSHFNGEKRPVENVSWDDCQKWLEDLSRKFPGMDVRLPTEAEWEYACRAGTTSAFHNNKECTEPEGKDAALNEIGWYRENSGSETHEVRQKKANGWGLYDMHGNVWEWCENFWSDRYPPGRQQNPKGPSGGSSRVLRGGCWFYDARRCRSACRRGTGPDSRNSGTGFRFLLQAGSRQGSQGEARSGPAKGAPPGGEKAGQGRAVRDKQ